MNNNDVIKNSGEKATETVNTQEDDEIRAAIQGGDVSSSAELSTVNKKKPVTEIGGPKGLEPTRYGDWEAKGRCYDF